MRTIFAAFVTFVTLTGPFAARGQSAYQAEIDAAYKLIFQTQLGRALCRQILGGERDAIRFHLGVTMETAEVIARGCPRGSHHQWIVPTRPEDIRKLTLNDSTPRTYKVVEAEVSFPIESWTEPFTNTTVLVTPALPITPERWVQILAHETAVYFDGKANPAHPEAQQIPQLKNLALLKAGKIDPLIALSNPLQSHALTFVRALQVEELILNELVQAGKLSADYSFLEPGQQRLTNDACADECLRSLVLKLRATLLPIGLPLLAFAPHYRSLILQELPRAPIGWHEPVWRNAQQVLNHLPIDFLKNQFGGDPLTDMKRVFEAGPEERQRFNEVALFLESELWPLEKDAVFGTTLRGFRAVTLLEFMKQPLLSGYNVGLSSGPRVRIRTGNVE